MDKPDYYPFVTVDAPKNTEKWCNQVESDLIRCAYDAQRAFLANDLKQLNVYIQHLRNNYEDYRHAEVASTYNVIWLYNWMKLARENLAKSPTCFTREQILNYYTEWFQTDSGGPAVLKWRKVDCTDEILRLAGYLISAQDRDSLRVLAEMLRTLVDSNVNVGNANYDAADLVGYLEDNAKALEISDSVEYRKAADLAKEWLGYTADDQVSGSDVPTGITNKVIKNILWKYGIKAGNSQLKIIDSLYTPNEDWCMMLLDVDGVQYIMVIADYLGRGIGNMIKNELSIPQDKFYLRTPLARYNQAAYYGEGDERNDDPYVNGKYVGRYLASYALTKVDKSLHLDHIR